jgi:hypothetical protein
MEWYQLGRADMLCNRVDQSKVSVQHKHIRSCLQLLMTYIGYDCLLAA